MERIELTASVGKVYKLQTEGDVIYGYKVNTTTEQASNWVEVDEAEYLAWKEAQEAELADM